MSTRNLYALLVGINDYPIEAHKLFGCHNDVQAAKEFLENRTRRDQFNLNLKTLLSGQATRTNIVRSFEEHLGQAGEDDLVFFYYSGHGSQEPAGSFFNHIEPDGQNETLVCWDSRIEDGMDLADKELATLIQVVAQRNPHIVVMLDCCHSGSGSRGLVEEPPKDYLVRQSPSSKKTRTLDSYILPRNLSTDRAALSVQGTQTLIIPESRHIALSAAESFELAKETTLGGSRRGVFSYSMIELLQTSTGDFTYDDVMRRARTVVGRRTFDQTPTIYAQNPGDIHTYFLDGSTSGSTTFFNLAMDRSEGWLIDGGAVHGIIAGSMGGETTVLSVFPEDTRAEDMDNPFHSIGTVEVMETRPNKSKVVPSPGLSLDRTQAYKTRISSLPVQSSKVFFFGDESGKGFLRSRLSRGGELASYVEEVASLEQADYKLLAIRNMYIISRVADGMGDPQIIARDGMDYRPLVEQVQGFGNASASQVLENLMHITKWERTLELNNPGSGIASSAVSIEVLEPFEDTVIPAGHNGHQFHFSPGAALPSFRVKLTNNSGKKLFCALLYMSSQFEINPNIIPEGGVWLEPGQSAFALNGEVIEADISENLLAFGVTKTQETFKLIMSSIRFHPTLLHMEALGEPQPEFRNIPDSTSSLDEVLQRGLRTGNRSAGSLDDWNTSELTVTILKR